MNNKDLVGIMLATFNGEKYLEEQFKSIFSQTYSNWKIYISDDGSNDNTMNIINAYKTKKPNKIIILNNTSNFKDAKLNFANIFKRIEECDYYMFCDQDDYWENNKIEKMIKFIKKKEEYYGKTPILVECDSYIADENLNIISNSLIKTTNKELPNSRMLNHMLVQNYIAGCNMLFNKELKREILEINSCCEMHDWWISLCASYTGHICFLNESLHFYRQHSNNTIGARKDNTILEQSISRFKKLFYLKKTFKIWKNYQSTVCSQAIELNKFFDSNKYSNSFQVTNEFIEIMNIKSKIKKIYKLYTNGFVPAELLRIIRLI